MKVERKIHRLADGDWTEQSAPVVLETPLTLFFNGKETVTLLTTGDHPRELAAGFFFSEGFIEDSGDILSLYMDERAGTVNLETRNPDERMLSLFEKRIVSSGCGKGSVYYHVLDSIKAGNVTVGSDLTLREDRVLKLMSTMSRTSELYRQTRGVHGAALCSEEKIHLFREDIGRHNAIDKIAGHCLLEGIDPAGFALMTTGRVSSEVVIKASRLGTQILISRASATSLALELADQVGMTVIGSVRGGRMTLYAHPERLERSG